MKKNMKRAAAMAMSLALAVSSVSGVLAYEAPAAEEQNPAVMGIFDKLPYTDVHVYDWFYPAVKYATEHGIFKGVTDTEFGPYVVMTRAMMVQTLYAMAGKPAVEQKVKFDDVAEDAWYADAVAWAYEYNIAVGYGNGKFGAEDKITRAQMAVMVWGYAGKAAAEDQGLAGFVDAEKVAEWSKEAINWAVENGLLAGSIGPAGPILAPDAKATRAEAAVMLSQLELTT